MESQNEYSLTNMRWGDNGTFVQAWLVNSENIPVAFVKMIHTMGGIELCDVEVRSEYRGNQLGMKIIRMMGDFFGQEVTHSDLLYTEAGLRSIAPMFASQHRGKKIKYPLPPMRFVKDWDTMEAMFKI